MILPTTSQRHHAATEYIHIRRRSMCLKKGSKKKEEEEGERKEKKNNNTLTTIYTYTHTYIYIFTDSVKKHEVVPVVVISRWWETEGGQGGGYVCFRG